MRAENRKIITLLVGGGLKVASLIFPPVIKEEPGS